MSPIPVILAMLTAVVVAAVTGFVLGYLVGRREGRRERGFSALPPEPATPPSPEKGE